MALPFAGAGALVATASQVDFFPPNPQPTDTITYQYSPAVVSPGGKFSAFGRGLDQPTAQRLYLIDPSLVETEVTPWRAPAGPKEGKDSRMVVALPNTVGAVPGSSPSPGVYQLRVGSSVASGDAADYRSNSVPLLLAAKVNEISTTLDALGKLYSFGGTGFVAGATELYLDTIPLVPLPVGSAPNPGEFAINNSLDVVAFRTPKSIAAGRYYVRLRVGGVEGPAVGRITLP
jgi:hypothetical protein